MQLVASITSRVVAAFVVLFAFCACAPEVGSERWCQMLRDKPRGDWTANEALDFARHCIID